MYHILFESVWLSDIGRMAEVRNVPHLALQGVSTGFVLIGYILLCEYRRISHFNGETCTV